MKTVIVEVRISWWFRWIYWPAVKISMSAFRAIGCEVFINEDKVHYWLRKSVKIKATNGEHPIDLIE